MNYAYTVIEKCSFPGKVVSFFLLKYFLYLVSFILVYGYQENQLEIGM